GPGAVSSAAIEGILTLEASSILAVTGGVIATDSPYVLDVTGSTTLAGNSTIDVANNGTGLGTLHLDDVNQSGGNRSLTKTGPGTLALSGVLSFAVLNTSAGITNLNSSFTNGTINDNGAVVNLNVDQTLDALNIGASGVVVLGGAAPAPLAFDAEVAAQAVPEPGSLHLLLAGALGWYARRQRPQRR
ncbi:MAG: PEP-CTERM sorting domain-containing protein, partial [Chthoniobacteraceae bacterium]